MMNNKQIIARNSEQRTIHRGEKRALFSVQAVACLQGCQVFQEEDEKVSEGFARERALPFEGPDVTCRGFICLNIAEGSNKLSDIELSKYLNTSETSLEEVLCCLDLILDDGHIAETQFEGYFRGG